MVNMSRPIGKKAILPDIPGMYGFITFVILVIFNGGKALIDGDTFWHIAAGQHMLANKEILTQDIFSHTAYGKSWTAHEWLSEVLMAWLHQHAGLIGVVIFFFLIAALTIWLLSRIVISVSNDLVTILCVSVALTFSMTHMLARPHVFSWLFGVITLYALYKQGRWLWLLPPLTALWANLHGGFVLGLALQGLFIGGTLLDDCFSTHQTNLATLFQQAKRPVTFFGLSILAAGINPFGFRLYLFPFQVTNKVFSTGIVEWLAPDLQQEWLFRCFLLFTLLLASLVNTQTTWTDRLFVLFFFNASLTHQRYMGMASVFLCPYFARAIKSLPWSRNRRFDNPTDSRQLQTSASSGPVFTIILALLLTFVSGPSHPNARIILETFLPLPYTKHPVDAVKYLNQTNITGKMFNNYSWGGYLIYALKPKQKVFIDGRADMYGERIFGDYKKIASLDSKAEEVLGHYDIDWVLYPADSTLIRYLKVTGKWKEIYSDEVASILIRKSLMSNLSDREKKP